MWLLKHKNLKQYMWGFLSLELECTEIAHFFGFERMLRIWPWIHRSIDMLLTRSQAEFYSGGFSFISTKEHFLQNLILQYSSTRLYKSMNILIQTLIRLKSWGTTTTFHSYMKQTSLVTNTREPYQVIQCN